jgi:flagellar motor switch protein FliN/FliY
MMDNQRKKEVAQAFAASFAEAIGEALKSATGSLWPFAVLNGGNPPTQQGMPIHYRLSLEGAFTGECFVEFYEPQVMSLLSKMLQEPLMEFTDLHSGTLARFIATATDGLVASRSGEYRQLKFRVERVSGLAFGGMFVVPIATSEEDPDIQMLLYFGGELLDTLSLLHESTDKGRGDKPVVAPHNLKLVMDVELNVSLRFGQRQLPLREVLDLASGSVIELDRMADEPVELYLDGKLIARGEAVVVDGNYGLRVTEIPQPVASYLAH